MTDAHPQWQPISTAPKNGTKFLACCETDCETRNHWIVSYSKKSKSFVCYDEAEDMSGGLLVPCLGFWMPLPAPPAATEKGLV